MKRRYENYYFKTLPDEPALISGLPLPKADGKPYMFVDCEFHPRLWEALQQMYRDSEYHGCNWSPVK